jgi:hypothetical protein
MDQEMGHGSPTPSRGSSDMGTFPHGETLEAPVLISWVIE